MTVRLAVLAGLALPTGCQAAPASPSPGTGTGERLAATRFDPPTVDTVGPASAGPGEPRDALALSSGRRPADAAAVVAVALPAAAAALGAGPNEHLHLEGIDWPGPAAAVVTVLSLQAASSDVRVRRAAVPISLLDGPPRVAGPALLLPVGGLDEPVASLATSPIDDEATWQAARAALASAGFTDVRLQRLDAAIEAWPVVATFRAGGGEGRGPDLVAWLRRDGARLVVAGLPGGVAGPPAHAATTTTDHRFDSEDPA